MRIYKNKNSTKKQKIKKSLFYYFVILSAFQRKRFRFKFQNMNKKWISDLPASIAFCTATRAKLNSKKTLRNEEMIMNKMKSTTHWVRWSRQTIRRTAAWPKLCSPYCTHENVRNSMRKWHACSKLIISHDLKRNKLTRINRYNHATDVSSISALTEIFSILLQRAMSRQA